MRNTKRRPVTVGRMLRSNFLERMHIEDHDHGQAHKFQLSLSVDDSWTGTTNTLKQKSLYYPDA